MTLSIVGFHKTEKKSAFGDQSYVANYGTLTPVGGGSVSPQAGDLLICVAQVMSGSTTGSPLAIDRPWTLLASGHVATNISYTGRIWSRVLTADDIADPTVTVSTSSSGPWMNANFMVIRGADSADFLGGVSPNPTVWNGAAGGNTEWTVNGLTPARDAMVFIIAQGRVEWYGNQPVGPAGYTERHRWMENTGSLNKGLTLIYERNGLTKDPVSNAVVDHPYAMHGSAFMLAIHGTAGPYFAEWDGTTLKKLQMKEWGGSSLSDRTSMITE